MTSNVAVIVPTFGSDEWKELGDYTALRVANLQTQQPEILRVHSDTLQNARNRALDYVSFDWLVFLDADDDLDPGFVEAVSSYDGNADILQTAVRGFRWTGPERTWIDPVPTLHKQTYPLLSQNYLIIGSPVRAEMFSQVGGFHDYPALEDWDLWLRCYNMGAQFDELYEAVYYINDDHHRNLSSEVDDIARKIRAANR